MKEHKQEDIMSFFDKLTYIAGTVTGKATQTVNLGKTGVKLTSEKAALADDYRRLGEYYYAKVKVGEISDDEAEPFIKAIDKTSETIATLEQQIKEAKANILLSSPNIEVKVIQPGKTCPLCGEKVYVSSKYCPQCGSKLEE